MYASLEHRTPSRHPKLAKALRLAQEHLDNNNQVNTFELAKMVNTSTRHLGRLFEQELGDTPARHLLKLRLERARQLLRRTHISLFEIASKRLAWHYSGLMPASLATLPQRTCSF